MKDLLFYLQCFRHRKFMHVTNSFIHSFQGGVWGISRTHTCRGTWLISPCCLRPGEARCREGLSGTRLWILLQRGWSTYGGVYEEWQALPLEPQHWRTQMERIRPSFQRKDGLDREPMWSGKRVARKECGVRNGAEKMNDRRAPSVHCSYFIYHICVLWLHRGIKTLWDGPKWNYP